MARNDADIGPVSDWEGDVVLLDGATVHMPRDALE